MQEQVDLIRTLQEIAAKRVTKLNPLERCAVAFGLAAQTVADMLVAPFAALGVTLRPTPMTPEDVALFDAVTVPRWMDNYGVSPIAALRLPPLPPMGMPPMTPEQLVMYWRGILPLTAERKGE